MSQSACREVTILCRVDRHTRTSTFKVWERTGLGGENAPRITLYEGASFAEAYEALTRAAEIIENGVLAGVS
jgi:hypothetical protein